MLVTPDVGIYIYIYMDVGHSEKPPNKKNPEVLEAPVEVFSLARVPNLTHRLKGMRTMFRPGTALGRCHRMGGHPAPILLGSGRTRVQRGVLKRSVKPDTPRMR